VSLQSPARRAEVQVVGGHADTPGHECAAPENRRRFGRLRAWEVRTSLGRVLDLSGGGMRVESRWPIRLKPGRAAEVSLVSEVGEFRVNVRVAWVRPGGLLLYRAGLEFTELTPRQCAMLTHLARVSAAGDRPSVGWTTVGR